MTAEQMAALWQELQALQDRGAALHAEAEGLYAKDDRTEAEETRLAAICDEMDEIAPKVQPLKDRIRKGQEQQQRAAAFAPMPRPAIGGTSIEIPEGARIISNETDPNRFATLGEQLAAVVQAARDPANVDPRLQFVAAATGLQEAVGADGGFLLQQEFSRELMVDAHETGQLSSRCRVIPAGPGAKSIKIPAVDERSRKTGSRWGGVQVYWEGEADQYTGSRPKFTKLELELQKLTGLCYATDEMLEDVVAMASIIEQAFREEFGFTIDEKIFEGNGVGMPQGFRKHAANVIVPKETGQGAATVVAANITKMHTRMPARYRPAAVWLINEDVEEQLPLMTVGDQPVYLPPGGIRDMPFGTLYGKPVIPIEQADELGTEGDINFVNLDQYLLYEKGGMKTATSIHVRFEFGEQAFRFTVRMDGKPAWPQSKLPFKGSNPRSPFITLATRA